MSDHEIRSNRPSDSSPKKAIAPGTLLAQTGLQVAAVDVEQMRSVIASRLFGTAAEPVRIGRFTVLRRVGAGAMGVVYAAYDEKLDRKVAIKVLHGSTDDPVNYTRLMREAQALAKVSHPNVIQIYEVSTFRDQIVLAMEFVEGKSLRSHVPRPKESLKSRLRPWIEAGRGLAAAHAAGLVHRDFKPDNLLLGTDGRVRVVDFGLAGVVQLGGQISGIDLGEKRIHDTDEAIIRRSSKQEGFEESLTETGVLMGTPAYMSPEQHRGERADARSDQFSFCVCVWESLYGERPFLGESREALVLATAEGKVGTRESKSEIRRVPTWLRRVLLRGLQANPRDRYPSMEALLAELGRDRQSQGWRWGIGLSMAGILAWGLWWHNSSLDPCAAGAERINGVWDQQSRTTLQQVFSSSGLAFAESSFNGTVQLLDQYSEKWIRVHRTVCQASVAKPGTHPDVLGRQMMCLAQSLTAIQQFLKLLRHADPESVGRAAEASSELPLIERCLNSSSVFDSQIVVDSSQRSKFDELLAQAENHLALWQFEKGEKVARAAVELAIEIDDLPGKARSQTVLGDLLGRSRQLKEAKRVLEQAIRNSDIVRDDFLRVRASISLLEVFRRLGEFERAESMAQDVQAVLEREGNPRILEARLFDEMGMVARVRGKFCQSVQYFEHALELRQEIYGADRIEIGKTLANLGSVLQQAGRIEEAIRHHAQASKILARTLGDRHPVVATVLGNLANDFYESGRITEHVDFHGAQKHYAEAEQRYRESIAIQVQTFGRAHIRVATFLQNLGEALRRQKKYADAIVTSEEVLGILQAQDNLPSARLAVLHGSIAGSYYGVGDYSSAQEHAERAFQQCKKCWDRSPEYLGEILFILARVLDANPALKLSPDIAFDFRQRLSSKGEAESESGLHHRKDPKSFLRVEPFNPVNLTKKEGPIAIAELARKAYQKAVDRSNDQGGESCSARIPGSYAGELAEVEAWIRRRTNNVD